MRKLRDRLAKLEDRRGRRAVVEWTAKDDIDLSRWVAFTLVSADPADAEQWAKAQWIAGFFLPRSSHVLPKPDSVATDM